MFWKKNEKQNWIIFWTFLLTCYTWNKYKLENEISFLTLGKTTECEFGNFNSKCSKSNSKEICLAAQNGRTNLKFAFINKHYMQILILTGKNLWRRHHSPVHISVITENILLTIIRYARYHLLLVSNRIYVTDSQYWGTIQIWWNLNEQLLTVCYCHLTYEFQSKSTLYSLPEFQGTPCSKQAPYLKFKWQQRYSNPQPLSL